MLVIPSDTDVHDHTRQYHDLYAAPAWRGYLSAGEMASLQQLFAKAKR